MTALIAAGLELAAQIFTLINSMESRKYIDRIVKLKLEIEHEEARGYDSDDAKIEMLHKEAEIIMEAAKSDINKLQAKPTA